MLKSTKTVLVLGTVLGGAVAVLPLRSYAATQIVSVDARVSATVAGVVGFAAKPVAGSNATYNEQNAAYERTFRPGDFTNEIGTTTYEVLCNYRSADYTGQVYTDSDGDGEFDDAVAGVTGANSDCSAGWHVTATAPSGYTQGGKAVMKQSNAQYVIESNTPADSSTLAGTTANWAMKVNDITKTVDTQSISKTLTTGYGSFHAVPASETEIISGNTFRTVNSVANTYIGTEKFSVTYGFNAGMAVAGTYTGQVTYTLYIGNN